MEREKQMMERAKQMNKQMTLNEAIRELDALFWRTQYEKMCKKAGELLDRVEGLEIANNELCEEVENYQEMCFQNGVFEELDDYSIEADMMKFDEAQAKIGGI